MDKITERAFLDELEKIGGWLGSGLQTLTGALTHPSGLKAGLSGLKEGVTSAYKAGGGGMWEGIKNVAKSPHGAALAIPAAGAAGMYGAYRYGKSQGQAPRPMGY